MSENDVVDAVCTYLYYKGWYVWRNNTIGVWDSKRQVYRKPPKWAVQGVSDVIAIKNGKVLFIECKFNKGRQSVGQKEFEKNIVSSGGTYVLAYSVDDLVSLGI